MPTTDLPSMNGAVAAMGQALRTAAKTRPAVTVYNTDVLLGTNAGTPAAHQPDGIHLSLTRLADDLQRPHRTPAYRRLVPA